MEPTTIDDQLLRKVNRQLRAIKIMLSLFFLLLIAMLAILGYVVYKVITFTRDINTKIDNFETKTSQNLDFKNKVCSNKSVTSFLAGSNDLCK